MRIDSASHDKVIEIIVHKFFPNFPLIFPVPTCYLLALCSKKSARLRKILSNFDTEGTIDRARCSAI